MNQLCRVCGEPAAGFHFGAFTCEGCKSFFGRTCNNVSSLGDCKNEGQCIINRKNRTACKACRLRKCLSVGMSKSGSRYGRRSNWFKIHCLMQNQTGSPSPENDEDSEKLLQRLHSGHNIQMKLKNESETSSNSEETDDAKVGNAGLPSSSIRDINHQPFTSCYNIDQQDPHNADGICLLSETLPLFAALTPFIFQSGVQPPPNIPNLQAISSYLPLLSLVAHSMKINQSQSISISPIKTNSPSPVACSGNDKKLNDVDWKVCKSVEDHLKNLPIEVTLDRYRNNGFNHNYNYFLHGNQECHDDKKLEQEIMRQNFITKLNKPGESDGTKDQNNQEKQNSKCDALKLKDIFLDKMKRSISPEDIENSNKRKKVADCESQFYSSNSDKITKIPFLNKFTNEQNEPIDLSVKRNSLEISASSLPFVACSMTVAPINGYQREVLGNNTTNSHISVHSLSSSTEKNSENTAVDLSCNS